ncbi:MAG: hypothetical protein ACFFE6_05355 [Candidatus Thorarchaeota archaeon]
MSRERGMFRIYHCARCNNIGYLAVESENEVSFCSFCRAVIVHETGIVYAVTKQEAQSSVRELVIESHLSKNRHGGNGRGLGLKRRVYNIIEALVDLNRGRPVTIENVIRECSEANIDLGRAMKFLDTLESEGMILNDGISISLTQEALSDV